MAGVFGKHVTPDQAVRDNKRAAGADSSSPVCGAEDWFSGLYAVDVGSQVIEQLVPRMTRPPLDVVDDPRHLA
jgi:hypothetical protein